MARVDEGVVREPGETGQRTDAPETRENRVVPMRLQRFLARSGVASRRGSENLMTAGRVSVNGLVVTELGAKVDPRVDEVRVDGKLVVYQEAPFTIMLNKPAGYLTTMSDPFGRPTVASLVPVTEHPGLFPIGRLDADTTGLLLFSTDGNLGNHLLHPRYHVEKTYCAFVEGVPSEADLACLREGIELEDGLTLPAKLWLARGKDELAEARRILAVAGREAKRGSFVFISIKEGRKRQVKRMFEAVGHPVLALHRKRFGALELQGIKEGSWRELTQAELDSLV